MGDQFRHSGERRKSRDQDLEDVEGSLVEPFSRSWMRRFWARGRPEMMSSGGKRSLGIGSKETDGS